MNLVCASSVTFGAEAFAPLGKVTLVPEGEISPAMVREADAVITRSKTRLTPALFEGSKVKFAGTCTAGTDHVDAEGLARAGIHFASAPGCNANAVSEYVLAALLEAHAATGFTFMGKTLGVVGVGEVGSRVAAKARLLGMRVLLNDPPRQAAGENGPWTCLDELVAESDVVTLHVPLVEDGPWPTRSLLSSEQVKSLKPGALLLNACRGEVLDQAAVIRARKTGAVSWLVVDVWDPEPDISPLLLETADIATPHIAGHSVEGKVNGTRQILETLCALFGVERPWDPGPLLPAPACGQITLPEHADFEKRLHAAVRACYDLREDDTALRANTDNRAALFTTLRRNYRDRREFDATLAQGCTPRETDVYRGLGFRVSA